VGDEGWLAADFVTDLTDGLLVGDRVVETRFFANRVSGVVETWFFANRVSEVRIRC